MTQISSSFSSRRLTHPQYYLIFFLSFSLLSGCCTSEALVPKSYTTFLPRVLQRVRGGSEGTGFTATTAARDPTSCILQVSRSSSSPSTSGISDSSSNNNNNNKKEEGNVGEGINIKKQKLNGRSTPSLQQQEQQENDYVDSQIPAQFIAETNLPTDVGQFRLRAYRTSQGSNEFMGNEPCVIYCANKPPFGKNSEQLLSDMPIRIHDQCLTSEVFRSQRCDCAQQLKMGLEYIAKNGGAIIYLQQEGRGIGLANKVAAYALQDVGMDTVDANLHLGFPEDARQYGAVPSILEDMKIGSIKLLTNNPRKVKRLRELGVEISSTEGMVIPTTNPYNHRYLEAKHDRMNHQNLKPLFVKNRNMIPKRANVAAETYVTEGEEMAANAVHLSLTQNGTAFQQDATVTEETQLGVLADEDGYCFGRQSVEDAIAAVRDGKMVVVVDDMNRENEGDLIMAADACTPEDMAIIVRYSSGVVCVGMEGSRMDDLKLPAMVTKNEDPKGTAFSVTVDATKEHGITTGISATDRAKTVRMLADPKVTEADFHRPGHIFPLRAKEGGVLARDGHTEAAVDLSKLAGRGSAGLLCEIVSEENPTEMARLPELKRFCKKHGYVLTSIVDIAQYRREMEEVAEFE